MLMYCNKLLIFDEYPLIVHILKNVIYVITYK